MSSQALFLRSQVTLFINMFMWLQWYIIYDSASLYNIGVYVYNPITSVMSLKSCKRTPITIFMYCKDTLLPVQYNRSCCYTNVTLNMGLNISRDLDMLDYAYFVCVCMCVCMLACMRNRKRECVYEWVSENFCIKKKWYLIGELRPDDLCTLENYLKQ